MSEGKPAWLAAHGRPWADHGGTTVHENDWIRLTDHVATAPSGAEVGGYAVLRFKNVAVAVLPLHPDGTVTLVGQNRFPAGDHVWEIPEGGAPMDEDPLDAARRELREEAGLEAALWRVVLPDLQLSNSTTDERGIGYLAMDFTEVPTDPDATEVLAIARAPFGEVLRAALDGWIKDLLTVAMLLRVHHMAVTGELPADLARAVLGGVESI